MRETRLPSMPAIASVMALLITGCGDFGRVEQGLVIDYDPGAGYVVLIHDSNPADPGNPRYDVLPPVTVRTPVNPAQMGPRPEAGKLLWVDTESSRIAVYDAAAGEIRTISFGLVSKVDNVFPNDRRVREGNLPRIEREKMMVTLYSPRTRQIVTITLPDDALALPADTWKSGDEVRYYYKDPAQALRMMNITKTRFS